MKNVLDFIPLGRNHAISMSELAKRMGTDQRTARKMVFAARQRGAVICSTCGENTSGYYRPNTVDEIRPYIAMQQSRIRSAKIALHSAENFVAETKVGENNG
ncbi:MAG: hypothetical protein OSJ54_13560 [Oscillospiraceae bacterium]|nr:hypothetical protein [Oscillospiraceae bacterium]